MSDDKRLRLVRRLSEMEGCRELQRQRDYAQAVQRQQQANGHLAHIEALIAAAGTSPAHDRAALASAAQLRALLAPARDTAEASAQQAAEGRARAESDLEASRARGRRLGEFEADTRRARTATALAREADARPGHRGRKP